MTIANGVLDASAISDLGGALKSVLISAGRTGWVWGAASNNIYTFYRKTLKGGSIPPGALLRMYGQWNKYLPATTGNNLEVRVVQGANSVLLGVMGNAATVGYASFEHLVQLTDDLKWGFRYTRNNYIMGEQNDSTTVNNIKSPFKSLVNTSEASTSPRNKSPLAFVSYSAPPTVETKIIDFSQDFDIVVTVQIGANERVELLGFHLEVIYQGVGASNDVSPISTLCPGDSLTEGTGATTGNDWVSALGKLRPGRPMIGEGLGGQNMQQIVDRILDHKISGKHWDIILWSGINNVDADQNVWWNGVYTQMERLRAFRAPGTRMLILNYHESLIWTTTQKAACAYVNAQLAATYGADVVDIATAVNGNASYYADNIHLTDAGYAAVAAAVDAKMTARGWA